MDKRSWTFNDIPCTHCTKTESLTMGRDAELICRSCLKKETYKWANKEMDNICDEIKHGNPEAGCNQNCPCQVPPFNEEYHEDLLAFLRGLSHDHREGVYADPVCPACKMEEHIEELEALEL